MGIGEYFFLGVKRHDCEADHLAVSNSGVKNSGAIPPLPLTSSWRYTSFIKHKYNFSLNTASKFSVSLHRFQINILYLFLILP
jgi:hypothetical protein